MCKKKYHNPHHCIDRVYGYEDLQFINGEGRIDFPNGFTLVVRNDAYGNLESMTIQDAPREFKNADFAQDMFPELSVMLQNLRRTVDVILISETIRKVQHLTDEDWKKFHDKEN